MLQDLPNGWLVGEASRFSRSQYGVLLAENRVAVAQQEGGDMGDDMNVRARLLGVVVLVLAIALVGCGGDGEANGSTSVTTGAEVDTTVQEDDSGDTTSTTEAATTTEAVASGAGPG
ncbi:MAG: hypothetical protein HKO76_03695, partial [Acidimicrobiia bacterium]|nr:hypothetical protein [Acidimicrobiia bacterium]